LRLYLPAEERKHRDVEIWIERGGGRGGERETARERVSERERERREREREHTSPG
jgi:hypothetical protein